MSCFSPIPVAETRSMTGLTVSRCLRHLVATMLVALVLAGTAGAEPPIATFGNSREGSTIFVDLQFLNHQVPPVPVIPQAATLRWLVSKVPGPGPELKPEETVFPATSTYVARLDAVLNIIVGNAVDDPRPTTQITLLEVHYVWSHADCAPSLCEATMEVPITVYNNAGFPF